MRRVFAFLFLPVIAACSQTPTPFQTDVIDTGSFDVVVDAAADAPTPNVCRGAGTMICDGNRARTCDADGGITETVECGTNSCVPGLGCRMCVPGHRLCTMDGRPGTCSADGNGVVAEMACAENAACTEGRCVDLCAAARERHSYIGCEYWPVATVNSSLGSLPSDPNNPRSPPTGVEGFPFAIAVANPQAVIAEIHVTGGALTTELTVGIRPGQLEVVRLPWVQDTSQVAQPTDTVHRPGSSADVPGGAYHVVSNVPVTVYQFSPLSYRDVRRASCDPDDQSCFSYTNDASLLLPTHVLTGHYTALSWPTQTLTNGSAYGSSSGFVTIVGTASVPTHVVVHLNGYLRASPTVAAAGPGDTIERDLNAGDVLELLSGEITTAASCNRDPTLFDPLRGLYVCRPNNQYDLTGSIIEADHPVAVFAGHDCANVPYNRSACDHLEEQLFPNETLGNHYLVSRTQPQLPQREPNVVRVVSNRDANVITFIPASVHAPVTLDRGQYADFEQRTDFEVTGTGPFATAQFLVGQNYFNSFLSAGTAGDPSLVLEVPVEQWRTSYTFLAPDTYPVTHVNVVAQHGAVISIDGTALTEISEPLNGFDVYRVNLSSRSGAHVIRSAGAETFSIKVYGFGAYTSYVYPGGLDLTLISPPG